MNPLESGFLTCSYIPDLIGPQSRKEGANKRSAQIVSELQSSINAVASKMDVQLKKVETVDGFGIYAASLDLA